MVDRGEGSWLITKDGNRIFDAIASWWVNVHGHAHPKIAQAIGRQALKLEQVIFAGFTHEPAENLVHLLLPTLPGKMDFAFFSDNGSTAVEVALKMCLQHFHIQGMKKGKIMALQNAYHGDTFGSMSVSGRGPFNAAFQDWLTDIKFVCPPYSTNTTYPESRNDELHAAKMAFESGEFAALIVEPILQGAGGMLIYDKTWLNQLMLLARENGVFIIADEVFTGFWKTGQAFACHQLEQTPDIICLSKGLTGGFLPMGLTTCNANVAAPFQSSESFKTFYHGHSFTANPLACAAALASFELTQTPEFESSVNMVAEKQFAFRQLVQQKWPQLKPRNLGSVFALTLEANDGIQYSHPLREKIYSHFMKRGILIRPMGNVLYSVPAFCTKPAEMDWLQEEILLFLNKIYPD